MNTVGIYLNLDTKRALRVQAMPAAPSKPGWVKVTDDPNAGLKTVREIARAHGLVPDPEAIQWDVDLEAIRKLASAAGVVEWPEAAMELPMVA